MKNKFKIGMLVKSIDNHYFITGKDKGFIGEVVSIIDNERMRVKVINLEGSFSNYIGYDYVVKSCHFKAIPIENRKIKNREIIIKRKDNKTIASKEGSTGCGISYCNPNDMYDKNFGTLLSVIRLLKFNDWFEKAIINAYFDDDPELSEYTDKEILDEIKKRVKK